MIRIGLVTFLSAAGLAIAVNGCAKRSESDGDIGSDASAKGGDVTYHVRASENAADTMSAYDLVIRIPSPDPKKSMLSLKGHVQGIIVQTNMDYTPPKPADPHTKLPVLQIDSGNTNDTSARLKVVYVPGKKM